MMLIFISILFIAQFCFCLPLHVYFPFDYLYFLAICFALFSQYFFLFFLLFLFAVFVNIVDATPHQTFLLLSFRKELSNEEVPMASITD